MWQEESEERSFGVRYEGTENVNPDWGSDYVSPKDAEKQAEILARKYGPGFYAVAVRKVVQTTRL